MYLQFLLRSVQKFGIISTKLRVRFNENICKLRYKNIRGLSGKYPAVLNISTTGHVTLM